MVCISVREKNSRSGNIQLGKEAALMTEEHCNNVSIGSEGTEEVA